MSDQEYPEHDKLREVVDLSQGIGEFIEWSRSNGYHFMRRGGRDEPRWVMETRPINEVLADFYGIDLDKLEREKLHMLDGLGRAHEARDQEEANRAVIEGRAAA